jgi:hypothetical protein
MTTVNLADLFFSFIEAKQWTDLFLFKDLLYAPGTPASVSDIIHDKGTSQIVKGTGRELLYFSTKHKGKWILKGHAHDFYNAAKACIESRCPASGIPRSTSPGDVASEHKQLSALEQFLAYALEFSAGARSQVSSDRRPGTGLAVVLSDSEPPQLAAAYSQPIPKLCIDVMIDMDCLHPDTDGEESATYNLFIGSTLLLDPHVGRNIKTAIKGLRESISAPFAALVPVCMTDTIGAMLQIDDEPQKSKHAILAKEMYVKYKEMLVMLTKYQRGGMHADSVYFVPLAMSISHTDMARAWKRQPPCKKFTTACMGADHRYTLNSIMANGKPAASFVEFPHVQLITPAATSILRGAIDRAIGEHATNAVIEDLMLKIPTQLASLWQLEILAQFRQSTLRYMSKDEIATQAMTQAVLIHTVRETAGLNVTKDRLAQAVARKRQARF